MFKQCQNGHYYDGNEFNFAEDCPQCRRWNKFNENLEDTLRSLERDRNNDSLNSLFGDSSLSSSSLLDSPSSEALGSYDPPRYRPPEPDSYGLPEPLGLPKPVLKPHGGQVGFRERDPMGRDSFRPLMGNVNYQVGPPSLFGSAYVHDLHGNIVGELRQNPLGDDMLLPPPDFGPSFR